MKTCASATSDGEYAAVRRTQHSPNWGSRVTLLPLGVRFGEPHFVLFPWYSMTKRLTEIDPTATSAGATVPQICIICLMLMNVHWKLCFHLMIIILIVFVGFYLRNRLLKAFHRGHIVMTRPTSVASSCSDVRCYAFY